MYMYLHLSDHPKCQAKVINSGSESLTLNPLTSFTQTPTYGL